MFPSSSRTRRLAFALSLLVPVARVAACEGDCITGITKALIGNYTLPVAFSMNSIANKLQAAIVASNKNSVISAASLLVPFIDQYKNQSYEHMENAVFKSYFHGKCQNPETGINPPGCPNPDCPVVCGTPGSIVHFYSTFRYIAFNSTIQQFDQIMDPKSPIYKRVERAIVAASTPPPPPARRQLSRIMPRNSEWLVPEYESNTDLDFSGESSACIDADSEEVDEHWEKRVDGIRSQMRGILHGFRQELITACGGTPDGKTNGLPRCSWENDMKNYILTFP